VEGGRPSETAARIALQRVSAAQDPFYRRLLRHPDEPYSAWFAEEHSPAARAELEGYRSPEADGRRRLADVLDPGGFTALLARKRFVEDEVRAGLEAGAEQVVVLGAGYDPLPLLLGPEFPRARFFELDHPATQAVKRRALEAHHALRPGLTLVPVDLASAPLEEALGQAHGFRPGAASAFVAEGLLMYLTPRDLDALLAGVVRLAGPGSRFVCSLLDRRAAQDTRRAVGRTAALVSRLGEPFRSAHSARSLPRFLARRRLRHRRICDARELFRLYLEPLGAVLLPREGELLVSAEVGP
jgi:methyltransferase (TIGR00027 family)